jgi:hypothetical protein
MTQRQRTIEERRVTGMPLGRHVFHDERSKEYAAEQASRIKAVSHAYHGLPLDQADVGSCTGEALCGALNTDPDSAQLKATVQGHVFTQPDAYKVYALETKNEGQPWVQGDPGSPDPGGTGLWVCKAARQLGWITSYRHAFGLQSALRALVLRPNIWGINWYEGFDTPEYESGVVRISGQIRGGHEILAREIILKGQPIPGAPVTAPDDLVGFVQSWGTWGLNGTGRFYATFGDLDRLLSEQGDVTVPIP